MAEVEFNYADRLAAARAEDPGRRIQDLEDEVADLKKERDTLFAENGSLKTRQAGIDGRLRHLETIAGQLEAVLNNLQGANGIKVDGGVISYVGAVTNA